jgi:hypothetical protein
LTVGPYWLGPTSSLFHRLNSVSALRSSGHQVGRLWCKHLGRPASHDLGRHYRVWPQRFSHLPPLTSVPSSAFARGKVATYGSLACRVTSLPSRRPEGLRSSARLCVTEAITYPDPAFPGISAPAFRPQPEGLSRSMLATSDAHPRAFDTAFPSAFHIV